MLGLLAAVERYLAMDHEARASQMEEIVAGWCTELNRLDGVTATRAFPSEANQPAPRAQVQIDPAVVGRTSREIDQGLLEGSPAVSVALGKTDETLMLNPMTLEDGEEEIVLARLVEEIKG